MVDLFVDGAHLFASLGRALGLGPRRVAGRFDAGRLIDALIAVLPPVVAAADTVRVRWFDSTPVGVRVLEHEVLSADARVDLVLLPLRGSGQRHVEAALLHGLLTQGSSTAYVAADPRQHALAFDVARGMGRSVLVLGVAGGERTPASRIWLRRPELQGLVIREARATSRARNSGAYQPPELRATPVRPYPIGRG